jgi:hypothetical protein
MPIMNGKLVMLKRCPKCRETKDASHYYYTAYTINHLYAYCKPCCKERDREKSKRRHTSPPTIVRESKVCGLCNQEKPVSQFGYNRYTTCPAGHGLPTIVVEEFLVTSFYSFTSFK